MSERAEPTSQERMQVVEDCTCGSMPSAKAASGPQNIGPACPHFMVLALMDDPCCEDDYDA